MVRIAMVAGEASSDLLASHLISAIKQRLPDAQFVGIGGPKMQRHGFDAWWPSEKLSVRGFVEVLRHYREIARIRRQLFQRLKKEPPDIFIGVDGYDFNSWLERRLKARGIRTAHFVSPSIWAWRRHRLKNIVASVDHLLALFPFEPALYAGTSVQCTFVGHPMADTIEPNISKKEVREQLDIPGDIPVVAILPGSRQSELQYLAETFIRTAMVLHQRNPAIRFLVPLISRETRGMFEAAMWRLKADELPITLMFGHAQEAIAASDVSLIASGTATLEAALVGRPMVIAYKMSPWSWRLMRNMGYLPWIGLPNILSQRFVVPEFLQDDANPENLAQAVENLIVDSGTRYRIGAAFAQLHSVLRQNTAEKAASVLIPQILHS